MPASSRRAVWVVLRLLRSVCCLRIAGHPRGKLLFPIVYANLMHFCTSLMCNIASHFVLPPKSYASRAQPSMLLIWKVGHSWWVTLLSWPWTAHVLAVMSSSKCLAVMSSSKSNAEHSMRIQLASSNPPRRAQVNDHN